MSANVPPSSFEELAELLGDEEEISQFDEATNTTIVTKSIEDGYQQIITTKEWVSDKIGKRTTTMVRTYYAAVEDEEEVEESVVEEEIDDAKLAELRANAPAPVEAEVVVGKDGKKKKKKSKIEGNADVVREAFEGGYKEITTIRFPDGSSKISTKMFYDPVEVPKSETQVVEETTTTKSGKKKKVKKVVNLNQEILETYDDDDGHAVTVAREAFPDGTGHKDITTTKMSNGQHKQTTTIVFYPKEKEIIETTEILEHEASSTRMNVKETIIKQHYESEETESKTTSSSKSTKSTKKKSTKSSVEQQAVEENNVQRQQVQVQQVQVQQSQQDSGVETKKITKKSTKKITGDEQREALMARDNSEGVTTVQREKTDKGYREISTTVFSDGSTKTQTREFFDAVEETVDPQQALEMRENLAVLATQPPQTHKNADGSTSTVTVERIGNGYRQTTTTKKLNGATSVQTREFYDPTEEEYDSNSNSKRRVVQSNQKIQGGQQNMMKSVKLFGWIFLRELVFCTFF